ncbi:pentatricopeptide repeat-containing protein [Trifolium repens]|nr:pentatricopeptide repeat-containing protein [Trifolium repens]
MKPNLNELVSTILNKINHINHLKQLQSHLTTLGHSQTHFYAFKLFRCCSIKLSNLHYAERIFNHIHSPNIYLFTAIITAYSSQQNNHSLTFSIFKNMLNSPIRPNHFIYPHVLKSSKERFLIGSVHAQIVKTGFLHYPVVETSLVDSYSKVLGGLRDAQKVFDEMSERNVVCFTALVSGYLRAGDVKCGLKVFDEMVERDVPAWNAVISGCTQNGFFSEGIRLFREMVFVAAAGEGGFCMGNKPNQVTVVCVLSACGHTSMLQLGKWVHGYIYRHGLVVDSFVSNALVDMYGKCGNLELARKVFEMDRCKRLTSWNSMINCYALHGNCEGAIAIFEQMVECGSGVSPDEVTFVGLLSACTHGGLVKQGCRYFEMMVKKYGIEPQIVHYGCLIDLLGRAGQFDEAMDVVKGMNMEPDEVVWGSLLNGCKVHGRNDLAEFAAKKLVEIDPHNGGYSIMLANIYGELGKWDEMRNVWCKLKQQKSYKIPGCSWIEVDDKVHQFYSLDQSNPKTEELYNVLESLFGYHSEVMVEM